jgi:hypothetical protein
MSVFVAYAASVITGMIILDKALGWHSKEIQEVDDRSMYTEMQRQGDQYTLDKLIIRVNELEKKINKETK